MKKLFCKDQLLTMAALLLLTVPFTSISGQTGSSKATAIPDSLNKIFQTSCLMCHGSKGEIMSKALLNFDKWQDYSDSKRSEKAGAICNKLTKGEMPPKSVRDSRPQLIPTKEQVSRICKWAESLKASAAKK